MASPAHRDQPVSLHSSLGPTTEHPGLTLIECSVTFGVSPHPAAQFTLLNEWLSSDFLKALPALKIRIRQDPLQAQIVSYCYAGTHEYKDTFKNGAEQKMK